MKIIDQTPLIKEDGTLSLVDRGRAILQFGAGWLKEIEAQKAVITVLDRVLDKKYTLLRNVTPPGLGTPIPLILVGPMGVYVMTVNPLPGMFSARGDQWGVISGGTLRPEKPNLLTRTEKMARAIQIYLKRQGYSDMNGVEAVLFCSNPSTNVDSVRPIIRVVMCDALERFAATIAQARHVLNPESVFDIVDRLLKPPTPSQPKPTQKAGAVPEKADSLLQDISQSRSETVPAFEAEPPPPSWLAEPAVPPAQIAGPAAPAVAGPQTRPPVRRRMAFTGRQWAILIAMFVIWIVIVLVLAFLIVRNFLIL